MSRGNFFLAAFLWLVIAFLVIFPLSILVLESFKIAETGGWGIGSNQVQNCAAKMDVFAFAWFIYNLSDIQAASVRRRHRGRRSTTARTLRSCARSRA